MEFSFQSKKVCDFSAPILSYEFSTTDTQSWRASITNVWVNFEATYVQIHKSFGHDFYTYYSSWSPFSKKKSSWFQHSYFKCGSTLKQDLYKFTKNLAVIFIETVVLEVLFPKKKEKTLNLSNPMSCYKFSTITVQSCEKDVSHAKSTSKIVLINSKGILIYSRTMASVSLWSSVWQFHCSNIEK